VGASHFYLTQTRILNQMHLSFLKSNITALRRELRYLLPYSSLRLTFSSPVLSLLEFLFFVLTFPFSSSRGEVATVWWTWARGPVAR
jgi:hypothetical protein